MNVKIPSSKSSITFRHGARSMNSCVCDSKSLLFLMFLNRNGLCFWSMLQLNLFFFGTFFCLIDFCQLHCHITNFFSDTHRLTQMCTFFITILWFYVSKVRDTHIQSSLSSAKVKKTVRIWIEWKQKTKWHTHTDAMRKKARKTENKWWKM